MAAQDGIGPEQDQQASPLLRFAVLGPVRAWRGTEALAMGSPQQRALLAALLLRGGHTATAQELVDALWGEDPPQQALSALRTYASRMRKALGPDADLLASESGGYAMRLGNGAAVLDADTAAQRAAEAEKAAATGDRSRARRLYDEALSQWAGEPLAGLPGPYAEGQRTRLEEWRLGLLEHRLDLDLQLGFHTEAVSELTALTAEYPLRERLRELLMLALYRSGRQAEALAVYADTRRLLSSELGVEPRPELSDLQSRILKADDSLVPEIPRPPSADGARVVRPAQLPAPVSDFTGRAGFVAELGEQLATAEGRVMAVSAVAGIGGVGKTTLAVHVAHAAREHFPDGQLYVDLQGSGAAPTEPEAVLGSFLRSLGTPDSAIPDGLEDRAALYRSLLDGRRVLTLLDNARDAAQIRPLLPGTVGCAALVTSRARMLDLAGAYLVDLDVMSPEEALTLFSRIVGEERVNAERKAAMDVVAACGFLPLAIRIAASRLAARRMWTVLVLAGKLADERRRLDELRAGDLAVQSTFELGYGQLESEQARAFRLLGLADGPDISLPAASALLDRSPEVTEELLESLVDSSLLESAAAGRYRYHDLVRLYARACAERDEQPPSEREAALGRLLDFYLSTAARVYAAERPGDRVVDHLATVPDCGLSFATHDEGLDWLFTEAECLLATARQQAHGSTLRRCADLLIATQDLNESGAVSWQYEQATRVVAAAAREAGDTWAEGRARIFLAYCLHVTGRFDEADAEIEQALTLGEATGDPIARSYAPNDRGIIVTHWARLKEAEKYHFQALAAFWEYDNRPGAASALANLSRVYTRMGRAEAAVDVADQAVAIQRELGSVLRLANTLYSLGNALNQAGRYAEAVQRLTEALSLFREKRQRLWEGNSLFRLGQVHLAAGRPAQAAAHAEQALTQGFFGGEWRRADVLVLLGRGLDSVGQHDRARACWNDALSILVELGAPEAEDVRALLAPPAFA